MTNNKQIRIARRINNRNKKEPGQRITIAEQKTNNNRNKKEPAQRITIAKQTTNNNRDKKKAIINNKTVKSGQRISIEKQEANGNHNKKDQRITIAERCKPANKRIRTIAKRKMNHYRTAKRKGYHHRSITDCNLCNAKEQRKAKHNRKTNGETRVANQNETKMGPRISDF